MDELTKQQKREIELSCEVLVKKYYDEKKRLLIEIEPDYENIFIYCDNTKEINMNHNIPYSNVFFIKTHHIIMFKNCLPIIRKITHKKNKIVHRFWRQKKYIKKDNIYFINVEKPWKQDDIQEIHFILKNIDMNQELLNVYHDIETTLKNFFENNEILVNINQNEIYLYSVGIKKIPG